mmetsp:Transcript_33922/g.85003  ORF Transcript_33922/g.85003 Transcript_33922/m.85003 type:complete len:225 (-) Transcript_33922:421-1095(-)
MTQDNLTGRIAIGGPLRQFGAPLRSRVRACCCNVPVARCKAVRLVERSHDRMWRRLRELRCQRQRAAQPKPRLRVHGIQLRRCARVEHSGAVIPGREPSHRSVAQEARTVGGCRIRVHGEPGRVPASGGGKLACAEGFVAELAHTLARSRSAVERHGLRILGTPQRWGDGPVEMVLELLEAVSDVLARGHLRHGDGLTVQWQSLGELADPPVAQRQADQVISQD